MIVAIRFVVLLWAALLWVLPAFAVAPAWQIVSEESSLSFTATQNNAPVTGKFNHFTGDIKFAPDQLNGSSVRIVIDTSSVTTSYQEVADTLKSADWLNTKVFPQAIFTADSFTQVADKTYTANGKLTLLDKTLPVTVNFSLEQYSPQATLVKGSAILKRTAFGVGKGDWAKTDNVKDEVQISFVLKAKQP